MLAVDEYTKFKPTHIVATTSKLSRLGTYVRDSAFCTGFSRLEVPEQALDGIPLGLGLV